MATLLRPRLKTIQQETECGLRPRIGCGDVSSRLNLTYTCWLGTVKPIQRCKVPVQQDKTAPMPVMDAKLSGGIQRIVSYPRNGFTGGLVRSEFGRQGRAVLAYCRDDLGRGGMGRVGVKMEGGGW